MHGETIKLPCGILMQQCLWYFG